MLNGWTLRSITLPESPKEIYRIAGSWVKQVSRIEGVEAASYMTIEEEEVYVTIEHEAVKQIKKRAEKKPSKEMSHIKCFSCDKMGHYSNKCPNKNNQDDEDEGEVHSSWHEEQEAAGLSRFGGFNEEK